MTNISESKTPNRARYEAYLGIYPTFGSYLSSYENAFNALIDNVAQSGSHVDTLAFPILFIARHTLELGFKANIRYFSKFSEKADFTNSDSHALLDLFNGFKYHIRETINNLKIKYEVEVSKEDIDEFERYCKVLDQLVDKFETLDSTSSNFRYPVDKKNRKVFQSNERVNILDIKELFDESMLLLNYTSSVFSQYTDYAKYIDEIYEKEMRSYVGI